MIVSKAYITKIPNEDDNIYQVRCPIMEDNTGTEALFDATVCADPSNYYGYEVDDCVYVTFEDDKYNQAIIIGKLYADIPKATKAYGIYNNLTVSDSVQLPNDTKIGKYNAKDIFDLYNKISGVDELTLKKYVRWENTEEQDSEGNWQDVYANKIKCLTGETYEQLLNEGEIYDNVLYFLSSAAPSEKGRE